MRPTWCPTCGGHSPDNCVTCKGTGRVKQTTTGLISSPALHPRYWTPAQRDTLLSKYGCYDAKTVGRQLQRSPNALKIYARRKCDGLNQRDGSGSYTAAQVATALGVEQKSLVSWRKHGLKMHSGWRAGKHVVHLIEEPDLIAFLRTHPEFYDETRVSPRLCKKLNLDLSLITAADKATAGSRETLDTRKQRALPAFKVVRCEDGASHATGKPIEVTVPRCDVSTRCPACGKTLSPVAIRYSNTVKAPAPLDTLSAARAAILRRTVELVSAEQLHTGEGHIVTIRTHLRGLVQDGLVSAVPVEKVRRDYPRVWYIATDKGRQVLALLEPLGE